MIELAKLIKKLLGFKMTRISVIESYKVTVTSRIIHYTFVFSLVSYKANNVDIISIVDGNGTTLRNEIRIDSVDLFSVLDTAYQKANVVFDKSSFSDESFKLYLIKLL